MKNKWIALCICALIVEAGVPTYAQQKATVTESSSVKTTTVQKQAGLPSETLVFVSEMGFDGKLVKGAPYSAEAVTESIQMLSDGNRIVNRSSSMIYRDSEGRTRREQTIKAISGVANVAEPLQTIFISDPVAGVSYSLDSRTRTAHKLSPMRLKVSGVGTGIGAGSGAGGGSGSSEAVGVGPGTSGAVGTVRIERAPLAASGPTAVHRPEPDIDVFTMPTQAPVAVGQPDIVFHREFFPSEVTSESLGKQTIEGVEAEGTRQTRTIPAGQIGNEAPISIVDERWYSPELQVTVMTRHNDPRYGETTYKLTNINRSEPALNLFEVPSDYTIQSPTTPAAGGMMFPGVLSEARTRISGGVLNSKAISLPNPEYPMAAKQAKASGTVSVEVGIDEDGNVVSAKAVSGHPLLQAAAVNAARQAKFAPTKLQGQPVKVNGVVVYNFVIDQ